MTFTYRGMLGRPMTWSELDENFQTVQTMSDDLAIALAGKANSGPNSDITSITGLTTALSITQGGTGAADAANALLALGGVPQSSPTGAVVVSSGTTAERPSVPVAGMIRYNTSVSDHERRSGSSWVRHGDMTGPLNEVAVASLASSTPTLIHLFGNTITITGTTGITSFGAGGVSGTTRRLIFAASLILTHNATSLILPGNANITTQAGDVMEVVCLGSGNWKCIAYMRASVAP